LALNEHEAPTDEHVPLIDVPVTVPWHVCPFPELVSVSVLPLIDPV